MEDLDDFLKAGTMEELKRLLGSREGRWSDSGQATRVVVDSVSGNSVRLLTAPQAKPHERDVSRLAQLDTWSMEEEEIISVGEAARRLRVPEDEILETKVFVVLEERTFDMTALVRQEAKRTYERLLSREGRAADRSQESEGAWSTR